MSLVFPARTRPAATTHQARTSFPFRSRLSSRTIGATAAEHLASVESLESKVRQRVPKSNPSCPAPQNKSGRPFSLPCPLSNPRPQLRRQLLSHLRLQLLTARCHIEYVDGFMRLGIHQHHLDIRAAAGN